MGLPLERPGEETIVSSFSFTQLLEPLVKDIDYTEGCAPRHRKFYVGARSAFPSAMLKNLRTQSPILRYGIAPLAVAIALLLTLPLSPLLKPTIFPLFFVAVMLSAWYGGLGSGLLATGLAAAAIEYSFIPAPGVLTDVDALARFALFVLAALLTSVVASRWKRADRALQESEMRFRSVTQSATDAMIVADSLGKIVVWNRTAQNMFGYQEAEVLGLSLIHI